MPWLNDSILNFLTAELTHGLCQRPLDDAPATVWYLATVLWPIRCCLSFYVTSSILAVKSRAVATLTMKRSLSAHLPGPVGWFVDVHHGEHFVHSDGHFWMCSAQNGPVASCLGFNRSKWPGVALLHCDSFVSLWCYTVVSCKWKVSYSLLEKQNCNMLFIATWRHCHIYKADYKMTGSDPGSV